MKNLFTNYFLFFIFLFISCVDKNRDAEIEKEIALRIKFDNLMYESNSKYSNGQYGESIQLASEAIDINPSDPSGYSLRGRSEMEIEEYSNAIVDFTSQLKMINETGKDKFGIWAACLNRGNAKEKLGDYRGALNDYNESINDKPDSNPNAYYSRGFLKYNNFNDINGACLDWSKAGEQGRTSAYDLINKYCN